MTNSSINSMIDTHSININEDINTTRTNKIQVTPANGNPIKEKAIVINPSPHVQTIQTKDQPLTEPNVGGGKRTGKRQGNLLLLLMQPQI